MAAQPSSLRTSFRALSITRTEIKECVIYMAEGDTDSLSEKTQFCLSVSWMLRKICSMENTLQSWQRCLVFCQSLDHFIRPREHVWRNCQTDLLSRVQVDHEFKLGRLLHRKISRFRSFEDLVHVVGGLAEQVLVVRPVGHEAA